LKYITPLPPMLTLRDGADLEIEKVQNIIGVAYTVWWSSK